jgi:hypothetical protein
MFKATGIKSHPVPSAIATPKGVPDAQFTNFQEVIPTNSPLCIVVAAVTSYTLSIPPHLLLVLIIIVSIKHIKYYFFLYISKIDCGSLFIVAVSPLFHHQEVGTHARLMSLSSIISFRAFCEAFATFSFVSALPSIRS